MGTLPSTGELTSRPFSYSAGLLALTPGQLRGPRFQRLARGAYWIAGEDVDHARRIQAARAVLPVTAPLAGKSAAFALGLHWAGSDDPVEVIQPPGARLRSRKEIAVRRVRLEPGEVVHTPLGYATSPARTAFDLARRGSLRDDVAWVDGLLKVTGIRKDSVQALVAVHPGVRGLRALDRVLDLSDPRAESPRESMLRVMLVQAGLERPQCQVVVRDPAGRFVARLDLAWLDLRIGVEYDGAHHRGAAQHSQDLRRHNRLRACGWTVIQVDAALLANEKALIELIRTVLATARTTD